MKRHLILCLIPLLLPACIDRVSMQSRYDKQRDKCRDVAEEKTGQAVETEDLGGENVRSPADNARNKELASNFSECMFTQGWTIATPPPVAAVAVQGQPPVGTPVAVGAGAATGAAAAGYGASGPYANNSTYPGQVVGGPVQASRLPAGAAAKPGQGLPGSPAGPGASLPPAAYYVPPTAVVAGGTAAAAVPVAAAAPASDGQKKKPAGNSAQAVFDAEFAPGR